jgi:hypothetical protein
MFLLDILGVKIVLSFDPFLGSVSMGRIEWASEFEERASFCEGVAAATGVGWIYRNYKVGAFKNRLYAWLVGLGVPGHWLDNPLHQPFPKDEAQIKRITPILRAYACGEKTLIQTKHTLRAFFDMPMPPRDAYYLSQYLDDELNGLDGSEGDLLCAANGISGMIETAYHDYKYRVAYGWPDRPCPWGGDDWIPDRGDDAVSFE